MAAIKRRISVCNFPLYFEQHYILWSFILSFGFSLCCLSIFCFLTHDIFYTDTDCYTRALRITDWLQNFQWQEKIFPYYNPPQGFILHWSRACDIIWGILALPFLLFLPIKTAVFYSGLLFSPLFMALTIIMILWGIKPYLANFKTKSLALLTVTETLLFYAVKLNDVFDAVRPDHHSLMCFVFSINVSVVLYNCRWQNLRYVFLAGIASGFGMWASSALEGFAVVLAMLFILTINWIFYSHSVKEQFYYVLGIFISVTFAWVVNPPIGGRMFIDIERLSIIHVVLTGLILAGFGSILYLKLQSKCQKISALMSVALLIIILLFMIFGFNVWVRTPFTADVWKYCFKYVAEIQHLPLISYEMLNIIVTILTLIGLFILCKKQKYLIDLGILAILYLAATICFWRFYPYFMILFLFLCGLLLFELLYRAQSNIKFKWFSLAYVVVPMLFLIAFYRCPERLKIPTLKNSALVDIMDVPELVFNQNIDALGGPYHTNTEGIVDNHTMWFTTDEKTLITLIKKHKIQSIYLKPYSRPDYYIEPLKNTDKLYGKVMSGQELYSWLTKIDDGHYEVDLTLF